MPDIAHQWGNDLTLDGTGDLLLSDGSDLGTERVLRRLLTNPNDYIWQPDYGAGLARFLGRPISRSRIAAVIRGQMYKEPAVARNPAPQIAVTSSANGTAVANIRYQDADTGTNSVLTVPVA